MPFDLDKERRKMAKRLERLTLLKLRDMQRGGPAKRTRRLSKEARAESRGSSWKQWRRS